LRGDWKSSAICNLLTSHGADSKQLKLFCHAHPNCSSILDRDVPGNYNSNGCRSRRPHRTRHRSENGWGGCIATCKTDRPQPRDHSLPHDESDNSAPTEEHVILEWTVHLLRRDPARARVIASCMLLSSALGVWMFQSAIFALVGPLLLFSATAEYLLPIRYRLTDSRATAAYGAARLEIAWDRVKRRDLAAGQIRLSPFAFSNRLDNFRGVCLRFAAPGESGDRDSVIRVVDERIAFARPTESRSAAAAPKGAVL